MTKKSTAKAAPKPGKGKVVAKAPVKGKVVARAPAKAKRKRTKAGTAALVSAQRRERFVTEYLGNGGNQTQAAIAAGFSERTASLTGHRLIREPKVAQLLAARREELSKKYEITPDLVFRSMAQELNFDPAKLFDENGNLLPIQDMDEDVRMVLTSLEAERYGKKDDEGSEAWEVRKVKWSGKQGAREQALKFLGLYEKDRAQGAPQIRIVMVPPKRPVEE